MRIICIYLFFSETREISPLELSRRLKYFPFDTDIFPEQYCRRLCERAVQMVSMEKVAVLPNNEIGPSLFYSILEFGTPNNESQLLVRAFQCPTDPPLYL